MENTIKVTGRGKISVKPDMVRLLLNLEEMADTYDGAVELSLRQTGEMKDSLAGAGFAPEDLKTLSFRVSAEYENYQEGQVWKRRQAGYKFTHSLKLEFPVADQVLGRIIHALSRCQAHPEFRIQYTVKDGEAVKNKLLENAMADSRAKAEILAGAAGAALGPVRQIDYSWGEVELVSKSAGLLRGCSMDDAPEPAAYNMDIEPDEVETTDTVTVVWELQ